MHLFQMFKNLVHNFFAKLCLTSDFKIKDIKLAQSTRNGLKKRSRLKNKTTFENEGRRSTLLFFVQRVRNNTKGICIRRPVPSTDQALPSCFYFRKNFSLL